MGNLQVAYTSRKIKCNATSSQAAYRQSIDFLESRPQTFYRVCELFKEQLGRPVCLSIIKYVSLFLLEHSGLVDKV